MDVKYQKFLDLVIYQIYPRSFLDSNGDGIGDISGVIKKLDYLCELGVNAVWMCPCYKSPNCDNGYDVADYRDIMDEFGTLEDIKALIREMHNRGMKLIMDLVPNHTSDQHKWFQESRKSKDNPYSDYYYWYDEPINNWKSEFGGSAWAYDKSRGQYYLHFYAVQQPDLNWENPKVVKEMQDVVDYWVDLGVDGFRIDVIDQISKDFEGNRNCFGPHLHEYIHALFGREKTKHIFTVGECFTNRIEEIYRHIASEREELSTLFQFDHMQRGRKDKFTPKPEGLKPVRDILVKWQTLMQEHDLLHALFTDNHDQSPLISRVGNDGELRYESATCMAAMFYLLKGVPFIFQGQELGIVASEYEDITCFDDIESVHAYEAFLESGLSKEEAIAKINFGSRDNARRPMPWDGSEFGGFSEVKAWIKPSSRLQEINLEKDLQSEKSVFRFYQKMLMLRKEHAAFRQGCFTVLSKPEDNYFVFTRELDGEKFTIFCNFEQDAVITIGDVTDSAAAERPVRGELVLSNYTLDREKNEAVYGRFKPYEIAVFRE